MVERGYNQIQTAEDHALYSGLGITAKDYCKSKSREAWRARADKLVPRSLTNLGFDSNLAVKIAACSHTRLGGLTWVTLIRLQDP